MDSLRFSIRCGADAPQMLVGGKVPSRRLPPAFASVSASALGPAPETTAPLQLSSLQLFLQVRSCVLERSSLGACLMRMGLAFACLITRHLARTHEEAFGNVWSPASSSPLLRCVPLQDQLARIPMFRPLVTQARLAKQASDASSAPSSSDADLGRGSGKQQPWALEKKRPRNRPVVLPADKPLWDMFVEYDINGDGEIDVEEMRAALLRMGLPCSHAYIQDMIQQFSRGSNDVVT